MVVLALDFLAFDDTRTREKVEEIEKVHTDEAKKQKKEKAVDAGWRSDDHIHDFKF